MKKLSGFTLVELLIVIVIMAVFAAVAIPKFMNKTQAAHEANLRSKLRVIRDALERFRADTGTFPTELAHLARRDNPEMGLSASGAGVPIKDPNFHGPYLDQNTAGIAANGSDLTDPVCGGVFGYVKSGPNIGKITPCAVGTALDGSNFENW